MEKRVGTVWREGFQEYVSVAWLVDHSLFAGPGIAEADENCRKFLQKTMPDAFNKVGVAYCAWLLSGCGLQVLTHEAVLRWDGIITDGIASMCKIALELIAERLKQQPIPVYLLDLLAVVRNLC